MRKGKTFIRCLGKDYAGLSQLCGWYRKTEWTMPTAFWG